MQNFLSVYSKIQNPTIEMVLFTFLLSFLLSTLVAFTYDKTTVRTFRATNFLQSLILCSMVSTMVLQAIGDNVASGLAMLGALNIIQFRTALRNPRDSVFIFASLGSGIACGLYGFFIAIIGITLFCFIAFLIRFTPFHIGHHAIWKLKIKGEELKRLSEDFEQAMNEYCHNWEQDAVFYELKGESKSIREYEFTILFHDDSRQQDFLKALEFMNMAILSLKKQAEK